MDDSQRERRGERPFGDRFNVPDADTVAALIGDAGAWAVRPTQVADLDAVPGEKIVLPL